MNFKFIPELEARNGYYLCLLGMAVLSGALGIWFKRIGWF